MKKLSLKLEHLKSLTPTQANEIAGGKETCTCEGEQGGGRYTANCAG